MVLLPPLHLESSPGDGVRSSLKIALISLGAGLAAVAFGFYYFGSAGMLDVGSPDFIPFPHAVAALGLVLCVSYVGKALLLSRRQGQFGMSSLDCNSPVLGESLSGVLKVEKAKGLTAPFQFHLRCVWRYKRRFEDGEVSKNPANEVLFDQALSVAPGGVGVGVPFRFAIPATGLPSGARSKPGGGEKLAMKFTDAGRIIWTVVVTSKLAGADYVSEFEIPVLTREMAEKKALRSEGEIDEDED